MPTSCYLINCLSQYVSLWVNSWHFVLSYLLCAHLCGKQLLINKIIPVKCNQSSMWLLCNSPLILHLSDWYYNLYTTVLKKTSLSSISFSYAHIIPHFFLGIYTCPCYYYPNRAGGSGRPSFVVACDLRSGHVPADHFIKRGTALLMSLDN